MFKIKSVFLFLRQRRISLWLTYFLIFLFLVSKPALATTIISPLLELEVDPGQVQKGIVKVLNETENDLFLVSSVEAFQAGNEAGQPAYLLESAKADFLKWFKVEQDSILLKPRQVAIIPFTVTVPKNAVPGGYYGVIFWQAVPNAEVKNIPVSVRGKVGTLIFLKVKGEVKEIGAVTEFSTKPIKKYFLRLPINLVVKFENSGNIHLRPSGEIQIQDFFGRKKNLSFNASNSYVLPKSSRQYEVVWGSQKPNNNFFQPVWSNFKQELNDLAFGQYTATLVLNYGIDKPQTVTKTVDFWLIPLDLIFVSLISLALLIILFIINLKIKKLKKSKKVSPLPLAETKNGKT